MFDWDEDYESLVAPVGVTVAALAPRRSVIDALGDGARRLALAALVALALGVAGAAALIGPADIRAQVASLGWMWGTQAAMPAALLHYEQSQFDNFRRGIAGFSDADLLGYANSLQRDLHSAGGLMTGFTRDALYLAQMEIDRRGLQRPVVLLRSPGSAL